MVFAEYVQCENKIQGRMDIYSAVSAITEVFISPWHKNSLICS